MRGREVLILPWSLFYWFLVWLSNPEEGFPQTSGWKKMFTPVWEQNYGRFQPKKRLWKQSGLDKLFCSFTDGFWVKQMPVFYISIEKNQYWSDYVYTCFLAPGFLGWKIWIRRQVTGDVLSALFFKPGWVKAHHLLLRASVKSYKKAPIAMQGGWFYAKLSSQF